MPDDEQQQTTPAGAEIPVPARDEFLRNLSKVAPPADTDERQPESARDADGAPEQ